MPNMTHGMDNRKRDRRTPYDLAQRRVLYEFGLGDTSIARTQGCTPSTVTLWRKQHGLPSNNPRGASRRVDHASVIASYQGGATLSETARAYRTTPQNVHGILTRKSIPRTHDGRRAKVGGMA